MVMVASPQLQQALEAAACLCGERDERIKVASSIGDEERLRIRLEKRLLAYQSKSGEVNIDDVSTLEEQTGQCALDALLNLHDAVLKEEERKSSQSSSGSAPVLGVRDLQIVQTLLSIVSVWRFAILVSNYDRALDQLQHATSIQEKLVELPSEAAQFKKEQSNLPTFISICSQIGSTLDRIKPLIGQEGSRSEVTNALMHTCMSHVTSLAIRLAYGPVMSRSDTEGKVRKESARNILQEILRSLSTASSLHILSAASQYGIATSQHTGKQIAAPIPQHVKMAIERLYSAQLLRSDGIMALLKITFGNDEDISGGDLMKKLASVGHLLSTSPQGMQVDTFARIIVPKLLEVVSEMPLTAADDPSRDLWKQSTDIQKNAACYALARLHEVMKDGVDQVFRSCIWQYLDPESISQTMIIGSIERAVKMLHQLVEHSEPSTVFLTSIIRPIWVPLFTLSAFFIDKKGVTISAKDSLTAGDIVLLSTSMLKTYLRIATNEEISALISPLSKKGIFVTRNGSVRSIDPAEEESLQPYWTVKESRLSFEWKQADTVNTLRDTMSLLDVKEMMPVLTSASEDASIPIELLSQLDLGPSSTLLASVLKDCQRKDITADLLRDLLDSYTLAKQKESSTQTGPHFSSDSIVYLQHITELIKEFGEGVLDGQADKILQFVSFSLGTEAKIVEQDTVRADARFQSGSPLDQLLNLNLPGTQKNEGDMIAGEADTELIETALNLLLSLLEGNKDISTNSHSILKVISSQVDYYATYSPDSEIQHLAREARLVLIARQSSKLSVLNSTDVRTPLQHAYAKGNTKYQEALKLLQDPILPVRAHGLVMLKDLASHGSIDISKGILMDPALINAIVDIYMQAIEDDESFLYLNAVKGLAEMANTGGRSMIKRLIALYLGSEQAQYSKMIVDKRLRVGEALLQVVQKLEEALSAYMDEVVGPLLAALRDSKRPTTLRTSYLSILGTCMEASPISFASGGYIDAVVDGLLDLLSVETTRKKRDNEQEKMQDPTLLDPKLPQLRRAAVLLLALLIRGSRHQLELAKERRDEENIDRDGLGSLRLPNGNVIGANGNQGSTRLQIMTPLLFNEGKNRRTTSVIQYLAQMDSDSLVRHQCTEVLQELDLLTLARLA